MNQELINYIKTQRSRGLADEQIRIALLEAGWTQLQIEEGFRNSFESQPNVSLSMSTIYSGYSASGAINRPQGGTSDYGKSTPPLTKIPSFGPLFKGAMDNVVQNLTPLIVLAFISVAVTVSLNLVSQFFVIQGLFSGGLAGSILIVVLSVLAAGSIESVSCLSIAALVTGVETSFAGALKRGARKFISFWWMSLLMILAVFTGMMLLLVPGIILMVWLSMAIFILLREEAKGFKALEKSAGLVRGFGGSVFWKMIVFGAFIALVSIIYIFLVSLAFAPFGESGAMTVIALLVSFLPFIIILPFSIAYQNEIFQSLKSIKGETVSTSKGIRTFLIIMMILGLLAVPAYSYYYYRAASRTNQALEEFNTSMRAYYDMRRLADLRSIQASLEDYCAQHSRYPSSLKELQDDFLMRVPKDPKTGLDYHYEATEDGDSYLLTAQAETVKNDPPEVVDGTITLRNQQGDTSKSLD